MELITNNVLEAWKATLNYILEHGSDFVDTDGRKCREVLNMSLVIKDPSKDFESPIDHMQQFEWIYPSKEELALIMLNKEQPAGYEYSYGPRIFNFHGKDQVNDFVIPLLKRDPTSRRAIIALFDPSADSNLLSKNIPSLLSIYFKILEGRLTMTCNIRSNDFFIGWPGNIYQVAMLQKHVADILGVAVGELTTVSSSAHIFHEHMEMMEAIIK